MCDGESGETENVETEPRNNYSRTLFCYSVLNSFLCCSFPNKIKQNSSQMLVVGDTIVSDDIADQFFVCHIEKCKGACCSAGDLGAPLAADELPILEAVYEQVKPYLSEAGRQTIAKEGLFIKDFEGDFSTPTIKDKECAYAIYDQHKTLKCGIEQAYLDGKIEFRKPISCHLYPIRIKNYGNFDALNYHRWDICSEACSLGKQLGVPIYKFLKDALIRKYGESWYNELVQQIESNAERLATVTK